MTKPKLKSANGTLEKKPRGKVSRKGGLFTIALFLGLSGVLRLGAGLGVALANTGTPTGDQAAVALACESKDDPKELLFALQEREKRLSQQEKLVAEREQSIKLARSKIDEKMAELETAERRLAATIAQADQAAEKDVTQLVAMYESMKPKDAARLFSEMEPEFAAGFLSRMQPAAAAAVLAGLEPGKAYSFSVVLAGRNALAPKS